MQTEIIAVEGRVPLTCQIEQDQGTRHDEAENRNNENEIGFACIAHDDTPQDFSFMLRRPGTAPGAPPLR